MEFVSRIMDLASPPPTENPAIETTLLSEISAVETTLASEIPAIETTLVPSLSEIPTTLAPSVSVKFDDVATEALPVKAPRKIRAGTPLPAKAHLTSSDSETEDSQRYDDERAESSEVSSSGLDFNEPEDPFDIVKNVEMVLPSKLRKSRSSETNVIQSSSSNLESHELPVGEVEKDDKTMAWHSMFRQRLSDPQRLKLHRSPVNACVLSEENAAGSVTMYSVDKDGYIKVGFPHTSTIRDLSNILT